MRRLGLIVAILVAAVDILYLAVVRGQGVSDQPWVTRFVAAYLAALAICAALAGNGGQQIGGRRGSDGSCDGRGVVEKGWIGLVGGDGGLDYSSSYSHGLARDRKGAGGVCAPGTEGPGNPLPSCAAGRAARTPVGYVCREVDSHDDSCRRFWTSIGDLDGIREVFPPLDGRGRTDADAHVGRAARVDQQVCPVREGSNDG